MKKLIGILLFVLTAEAQAAITHTDSTFVFADALIWQLRAGAADNWGQQIGRSGNNAIFNVLDAPYEWNTGIRLGVGREFNNGSLMCCWPILTIRLMPAITARVKLFQP